MAEAQVDKAGKSDVNAVGPFGVEADHRRNSDLLLQGIPGVRLRSCIRGDKPVWSKIRKRFVIPPDQAAHLGQFPPMPGMQVHVNPAKLTYAITDPLHDDDKLCEQIKQSLDQTGPFRSLSRLEGVEDKRGTLDKDRMKTLVRELVRIVGDGDAKVVKGELPSMEDVDRMPGKYLLNPGSKLHNGQPRYEEDFEGWCDRLQKAGG
jgi:hypothetical protein